MNGRAIPLCDELKPGERIRFTGGSTAKIHDRNWKTLSTSNIGLAAIQLTKGETIIDIT